MADSNSVKDTWLSSEKAVEASGPPVVANAPLQRDPNPEEAARWYSFPLQTWLSGFVHKAAKNPLQFDDLFSLHPNFLTKNSTDRMVASVAKYTDLKHLNGSTEETPQNIDDSKGKKPVLTAKERELKWALLKGLIHAERNKIIMAVSLHATHLVAQLLAPIFLSQLLNAQAYSAHAYAMVVALFICQMFQALCWNNSQYISRGAAMSIKAALTSMVYKKALRLGTKGRMEYPTGVIMNLIASDCNVISDSLQFLSDVFVMPFEILSLSILIVVFAGPAGAAGLAFMVLCTAASMSISSLSMKFERKALAATDERVKVTGEVINGIKIVKFFAWENSFFDRLTTLRDRELKQHIRLRMIGASFSAIMNILPSFVNVITFSVYRSLGNVVDAATVFSTLSIVNLIKLPIAVAPLILQMVFTSLVSFERLAKFFAAEELSDEPLSIETEQELQDGNAIVWNQASFEWAGVKSAGVEPIENDNKALSDTKETAGSKSNETLIANENDIDLKDLAPSTATAFRLKGVDLKIKKGSLTIVVGRVGAGKSSLAQAIIGDMIQVDGTAKSFGRIGYSPQAAWLQNASLRANILFGDTFDEQRYNQVIHCCSLTKDLELLPHGDQSDIGEKGVTLSGGQAARVNLARAVYSDADIMLLDDPLAAVDSHVGKHILEECILGFCRDKTVVLITHQLHVAHHADHIIVLDNGEISEQGSYDELMAAGGGFNSLMQEHGRKPTDEEDEEAEKKKSGKEKGKNDAVLKENDKKGDDLMEEEERITGSVSWKYYLFYFQNSGSLVYIAFLIVFFGVWQAVAIFNNLWLTFWVSYQFGPSDSFYMVGLALLALVQSFLIAFLTISLARACINSGRNIHKRALASILRVPMLFFETNPSGRIISRFSRDFSETDRVLPRLFQSNMETTLNVLGTLVLIVYASPFMLIVIAAIIPVYGYILKMYRACLRELKRIEALSRSPLYAQISESFAGISTIRAFGASERFILTQEKLQDTANRPTYIINCLDIWVSVRAESFVAILIGFLALLGVILNIDTALLGLALSYCLSMMVLLNFGLRNIAELEARMNSVERLSHYITDLKPEGTPREHTITQPVSKSWPTQGTMSFKNLSIKYRPELEPVLHSLTFDIPGGTKVGVVGRTGAGKSSIISAVFRLVEFHEGTIEVDGVDISCLELSDLRSRMAIIPQAPILFDGTIRSNLDPFIHHTDDELWAVLDKCSLKEFVSNLGGKLEAPVAEGGSNLSIGQRQLLCLGRAMLVKSKVLLIDEATASVDLETDLYIQKVLRDEFSECTILCIAHRLNTLMDYDKILVLESGRLMEFDSPNNLANKPTSLFSALIDETGASNAQILRKMAADK
ncbi:P-loop containing nucleoside triphosphate hydrolase protein [Obelidium mucronatum]|nr:P-loop containing nucleoside triphosphate hydrolase protein [Obelidium mucronatum]